MESKLVNSVTEKTPLIVICGEEVSEEKKKLLQEKGVEVICVSTCEGEVSIEETVKELGKRSISAVLVEGGGQVNASFVKAGKVNSVYTYLGAKIFGGTGKYTPVTGEGIDDVNEALVLCKPEVQVFGADVLIHYEIDREKNRI